MVKVTESRMVVAGAGEDSGALVLTGHEGSFEKNGKVLQMMW